MLVRYLCVCVVGLAVLAAGDAVSQDGLRASDTDTSHDTDSYIAAPEDSYVVEEDDMVAAGIMPQRPNEARERCRAYETEDGDSGTACEQPDGAWRIVTGPTMQTQEVPDYTDDEDMPPAWRAPPRRDNYASDATRRENFSLNWRRWNAEPRRRGPRSLWYE